MKGTSLRAQRSNLRCRELDPSLHSGHRQTGGLPRPFGPPKEIDGFCCGRIEIATVAALLRNDIRGLFSFLCILRIISGAPSDNSVFETKTGFLLFWIPAAKRLRCSQ